MSFKDFNTAMTELFEANDKALPKQLAARAFALNKKDHNGDATRGECFASVLALAGGERGEKLQALFYAFNHTNTFCHGQG